ncbi:Glycosyltransferase involved in cell wall bisynthesis [Pseudomonas sp. NFPP10]|nr:Glycosyltransferase involved in cell wall bisynthesis [Pseudomonas sp. NFPP12]SEL56593.1 Glycosyltransferase involved in cell wall bisynthesis [Pseudomonas sp. NFPP10]SEQ46656.1 Glycosyltransferase involved in cell wall bisynthesis [Pseudomonas sp. NFPP19]SFJ25050.1 Glycosyltransferase involved in cell wall bisynthesis [Pseudomonas sp. NFPP08]SFM77869.1 Glycosyltransferase involved in cell wall bisynthesis [Pseudomonas sp. NFPP05]SFX55164.1 Glycosyltransferase involved in cell wall bisynthe
MQPWYKRLVRREQDGAVEIIRTYTYSELHRSYLGRLISFISFSLTAPIGLMKVSRPDVVLASSPPIFPMLSVWLVCKLRRIPMVFEVRDLWPESAIQMGILSNRQLIGIMYWMERLLYDKAARIVTLTQGIHDDIQARGWPAKKLEVITCGIDTQMLFPDAKAGQAVRQEQGWEGRKIVLYFGALGEANNLDVIIDAAAHSKDEKLLFLLIGDGMKRAHIERRIAQLQIDNVQLLAPVSKSLARGFINSADVCLVTLQDISLFKGAIPTKLLDYMACGKPVLCGVEGEAAAIISAADAGVNFPPNNSRQLASVLATLMKDQALRERMGSNGAQYIQKNFDAIRGRLAMEKLLSKVANENSTPRTRQK